MKFALGMPGLILYPPIVGPWEADATPAELVGVAQRADELGWDWLTISEHIVMPNDMAGVMGRRFPDALVAAAVLAGATRRINVLTYVLVVPYRNPVVLAKQVATVDFLSGGRFLFGVGVGHAKGEFDAIGVPMADRDARTNEYLEAMVELWTKDDPRFDGKFVKFADIAFEPKPVQKPHPPILMGGNSKPAMRRAAKYADGWLPWLITRDQLPECLDYIRSRPEFDQRQRTRPFEVVMPVSPIKVEDYSHKIVGETAVPLGVDELIDEIGTHERAGVTVTQAAPPRTQSRAYFLEWIQWFAEEVMPAFRGGPQMSTDQS